MKKLREMPRLARWLILIAAVSGAVATILDLTGHAGWPFYWAGLALIVASYGVRVAKYEDPPRQIHDKAHDGMDRPPDY